MARQQKPHINVFAVLIAKNVRLIILEKYAN
jgi:hypothetical protein